MRTSVQNRGEDEVGYCRSLIAQLQQLGQTIFLDAVKLVRWKRGMKRDIGKKSQCAVELRCWRMKRESARLPAGLWEQTNAEERRLVRDVQTLPRRGSLTEQRSGEVRYSRLPRRIRGAPTTDDQHEISKWQLMLLDDHQLESVRELPRHDRR